MMDEYLAALKNFKPAAKLGKPVVDQHGVKYRDLIDDEGRFSNYTSYTLPDDPEMIHLLTKEQLKDKIGPQAFEAIFGSSK